MIVRVHSRTINLPSPTFAAMREWTQTADFTPHTEAMLLAAYEAGARDVLSQIEGTCGAHLERALLGADGE